MLRNPRQFVGEIIVKKTNHGYSLQLFANQQLKSECFYDFKHNFLSNRNNDPRSLVANARKFAENATKLKISNISVNGDTALIRPVVEGLKQAGLSVSKQEPTAPNLAFTRLKKRRV